VQVKLDSNTSNTPAASGGLHSRLGCSHQGGGGLGVGSRASDLLQIFLKNLVMAGLSCAGPGFRVLRSTTPAFSQCSRMVLLSLSRQILKT
jgi:hypothetical protein